MLDREKLVEIINDFFGCDAAYFDVNPFDLAAHMIDNGVTIPVCCKDCRYWDVDPDTYGAAFGPEGCCFGICDGANTTKLTIPVHTEKGKMNEFL